jgi:hypothetical protein
MADSPSRTDSPSQKDSSSISDDDEAEQEADLPLTMAASVILNQLPKDAKTALEGVAAGGVLGGGKGAVADRGISSIVTCFYYVILFHFYTSFSTLSSSSSSLPLFLSPSLLLLTFYSRPTYPSTKLL